MTVIALLAILSKLRTEVSAKLAAQMFLVVIDFDTLRLVDQSEVLISFVFILQSSVIVLFNTFTR